jgi:hypothetical protein
MIMRSANLPAHDKQWQQITITLGPVPKYPYDPWEPINVATKRAVNNGFTVVVAAGNEGNLVSGNSLNPWACAPWVIGVGATNENGTRLLDSSSRGTAEITYKAPTIVAPGEFSSLGGLGHGEKVAIENIKASPPGTMNTSIIGHDVFLFFKDKDGQITVTMMQGEKPGPAVPLQMFLDWMKQHKSSKPMTIVGTSFAAEYITGVCGYIAAHLKERMPDLPKTDRPKVLKTALEEMAKPFDAYKSWEVGRGLVTQRIAEDYVASLSDENLKRLVAKARHG